MTSKRLRPFLLLLLAGCSVVCAQPPATITLAQAQSFALQNHPRIASAAFLAQAGQAQVKEAHSAYLPSFSANLTGVEAQHESTLMVGAVPTSSLYSRAASGLSGSQLLTDFGRTSSFVKSAKLRHESEDQDVVNARAQVLLNVNIAYYQALSARAVLKAARANLDLFNLTLRQVKSLAQSSLRSTLDVSFAQVNVSQAELELVQAEDDERASHARLSAAMGYERDQAFDLSDEPLPSALEPDVNVLVNRAMQERPDLEASRLNFQSMERYAQAEKRLWNPTITVAGVAGVAPEREQPLHETYSAAGINVSIPVLNGGLFAARHAEAEARAQSAQKDVQDLSVQIARDVQVTWLDANNAFRKLDVTARMVTQANDALRLAQARYESSLGSIVELNQAQVSQTAAEIAAASAKYEYLERRAALDYAMGALK